MYFNVPQVGGCQRLCRFRIFLCILKGVGNLVKEGEEEAPPS